MTNGLLYGTGKSFIKPILCFSTLQLFAVIGKRIVSKKTNRNLLNLHAGFASDIFDGVEKGHIGASMGGKGQLYPSHYYDFSKPGYSQIAEDYLLRKSIGSIYVSVYKDFFFLSDFSYFLHLVIIKVFGK